MWTIEIENVRGIRSGEATIDRGTNVIQASNWQGKTSFLTAIRTGLGGEYAPSVLTQGEQRGRISMRFDDGDEYEVILERHDGGVSRSGTTYIDDEPQRTCAELFAFLDADNEVRTAVREGRDLTDLLTRPLERENLEERIAELRDRRRELESALAEAERAAEELVDAKERRNELTGDLDALREELEGLEPAHGDGDDERAALNDARKRRQQEIQTVERLENKVQSLETQVEEKERRLEELEVPADPGRDDELADKRDRLQRTEEKVELLRTLHSANRQILDRDRLDVVTEVSRELDDDALECWICGNETTRSNVEATVTQLQESLEAQQERAAALREDVREIEQRHQEIREKEREEEQLSRSLSDLRTELEESRDALQTSRERVEDLDRRIEQLESEVVESDDRRGELEREIAAKEAELDRLEDRIDSLESQAEERGALANDVEETGDEIERLRSRRERTIEDARTAFQAALDEVVDRFEPSFEGARLEKHTDPETGKTERLALVIARGGREISVDVMSEGEVELVGFMVALAGYEAFDVQEKVPCILLDGVGALAAEHVATLVSYFEEKTTFVLTSAYPEEGDVGANVVSPREWETVSTGSPA